MFKDRLKEARLSNNLTQADVAKMIGVAKSTYTGYELGNSEPDSERISKLLSVLKVDANFLWQDAMDESGGFDSKVTYDELKLIEKYRNLDTHGKAAVNWLLAHEAARSSSISMLSEET